MPGLAAKVLLLLALAIPQSANREGEVAFGNKVGGTVQISSQSESISAELVLKQVELPMLGVFSGHGAVFVVREPMSGLFWLTSQHTSGPSDLNSEKARFLEDHRLGTDGQKIVGFAAEGRSLWVRASSGKSKSMEAIFDEIGHELKSEAPQIKSGAKSWAKQFNLSQVLGLEYFSPKSAKELGGPAGHGLKLKSVVKDKDGWELEVANDRGDVRLVMMDDSLTTA